MLSVTHTGSGCRPFLTFCVRRLKYAAAGILPRRQNDCPDFGRAMKGLNMTRIYVIRHCEAAGNKNRTFQGHLDGLPSENGYAQLEKLSERMKDEPLDAIYSSTLSRSLKTAEAVNLHFGYPITQREDLMEINGGVWEGKRWADFPTLYPEDSYNWSLAPWKFHPENGEAMTEVYKRIYNAILGIVRENRGKTVAVVSHGCAIRNLMCRVKGLPIESLNDVEWCDNTAVSIIDFDDNDSPTLVLEGDSSHLSGELSTLSKQSWWKKENRDKLVYDD